MGFQHGLHVRCMGLITRQLQYTVESMGWER